MSTKERFLIDTIFRCMRMMSAAIQGAWPGVKIRVSIDWPNVPVPVGESATMTAVPEFSEQERMAV